MSGVSTIPLEYYQGMASDPSRTLWFDGVFAGLYRTDARPVAGHTRRIALPRWAQPPIRYEIAVVKASSHLSAARAYVKKVTSRRGRKLLAAAGFGLPK